MDLKGKQTVRPAGLLVVVDQFGRLDPVDVMGEVIPLGSNPVGIPFPLLDRLADFLGIPKRGGLLLQLALVVEGKDGLLPTGGENSTESLSVANSRPPVSRLEIRLVASDAPAVVIAWLDETAVLYAAVPTLDLEVDVKIEILELSSFQMAKVFPLVGFSLVVCPTMAPSFTLQNLGSPSQPFMVFPSKSFFSA